ncbi:cytochrome P450 [Sinomicrobium weinanense]|uniref:Cytochrome P450 n=1 Tax=Sinomicrobium weinanense TaxID=2842200 RepID=A0A926JSS7_9FLAO|nr:cytochrome P450 [Sinomicrobium weinanense]MBC9796862.1 cytochrome P450 [Sinomicrobium weinanense]MBU3123887.1 cytochrome P450 [Sinomicrobium weinanense]
MANYKYPDKVPFLKFLVHASDIARNPIPFHTKIFREYGDTISLRRFYTPPVILTRDPAVVRHVLQKNHRSYKKSKLQTEFLSRYIGHGLLTSTGDYWLRQRRLIQPGFHKDRIRELVDTINRTIDEQVRSFRTGTFVELYPLMNRLAFEVVSKSLFNYAASPEILKRLQVIIEDLQKFTVKEMRQPLKRLWFNIRGEVKEHLKLAEEGREIINTIIEARKVSGKEHGDLLDMFLHSEYDDGTKMTNDQLIDEILILFVAGHETTASALTFTLFLLANHPEELERARAESLRLKNSEEALEALGKMEHITCCIEESMRLYPPVWVMDRISLEDDTVEKYAVKKGTLFGISVYEMHRNPEYWEDPETFNPGRFSENGNKRNEAYMPFGAGPRLCIGNNFAMYEMMLAVNTIINTFDIETNKAEVEINPLITLKPVDVELRLTRRV